MIYIASNKQRYSTMFGIISLIIGLIVMNNPFGTLKFFAAIFAWSILLWGIINLVSYRFTKSLNVGGTILLTQGIMNILFSLIILMSLSLAVKTIMGIFGLYILIISMLKISHGIKLKRYKIVNADVTILYGITGIIFGILLFVFPQIVPLILGIFLVVIGAITILNSVIKK